MRKRIEVSKPVKSKFVEVKKKLQMTTESQATAFLLVLFDRMIGSGEMSIKEFEKLKRLAEDMDRQQTLL
ncbi:hypothetical protein [Paenibacillus taichungensis]|uniref:hypothetical protein n=1 Tax=Paenibacillus taichungensis TaxID=484184 RepID=UPI0035E34D29